jgi:hypothetical protein
MQLKILGTVELKKEGGWDKKNSNLESRKGTRQYFVSNPDKIMFCTINSYDVYNAWLSGEVNVKPLYATKLSKK